MTNVDGKVSDFDINIEGGPPVILSTFSFFKVLNISRESATIFQETINIKTEGVYQINLYFKNGVNNTHRKLNDEEISKSKKKW